MPKYLLSNLNQRLTIKMISYCRNPACDNFKNPPHHVYCHGCGLPLAGELLFWKNRYRVVKVLGQGAFGRTYQAEDLECLSRTCVIKKFIAQGQGQELEMAEKLFDREAEQLNRLDHPQIPRLYAYFQEKRCQRHPMRSPIFVVLPELVYFSIMKTAFFSIIYIVQLAQGKNSYGRRLGKEIYL